MVPRRRRDPCAERLERVRFVWPSAPGGIAVLTPAQFARLIEALDGPVSERTWTKGGRRLLAVGARAFGTAGLDEHELIGLLVRIEMSPS